uniref:Fucosyltransferase n=1 Tax=Hirondellea gigas TaxID=1518452 RepID=A0A2P2I9W7_9CRUS
MEPPIYAHYNLQNLRNIFNYTMTFYRDSDIYNPYGLFVRRRHPQLELEGKDYAAGKSKMAVWFASHCPTRSLRERLVKELQKHVSVTTYGGCGVNSCPIMDTQNSDRCLRIMEKLYKFYLAFENALCTEYVTEKFFGAARFDMVPVVYGFADYSAVAPPHSYINVLDFPSVKHLADYLLYLDRNHTAYNQYFRWKVEYESLMYYRALKPHDYNNISWCQLCEKLHTDNQTKSYRSLAIWPPRATCLNHKNRHIKSFVSGAQTRLL